MGCLSLNWYAKKNITINCVSPGFIQTKMTDKISEDMKSILISKVPMNKLGAGLDVSNSVAFYHLMQLHI